MSVTYKDNDTPAYMQNMFIRLYFIQLYRPCLSLYMSNEIYISAFKGGVKLNVLCILIVAIAAS